MCGCAVRWKRTSVSQEAAAFFVRKEECPLPANGGKRFFLNFVTYMQKHIPEAVIVKTDVCSIRKKTFLSLRVFS
jgi:hypothetical protein